MKKGTDLQAEKLNRWGSLRRSMTIIAAALTLEMATIVAGHADVVAHWKFDEANGSIAALDSAGSFNGNLSISGATFVSGGISGNAISLDRAQNGYVEMGNVLGLNVGDFSIVTWIKMNAGDQVRDTIVLSKHERGYNNGYIIGVNLLGDGGQTDKAVFYEGSVLGGPVSTTSVNDGNWHQIITVLNVAAGTKSIYVDGAPAQSVRAIEAFFGNVAPFLIGASGPDPVGAFSGLIDDVQVYNHALSDADVDFLFHHPGEVVAALDCSQKLATAQSQLAAANAANAALQEQLTACNNALAAANQNTLDLLYPMQQLTLNFRTTFRDPAFQIRGGTPAVQMQNLVSEILNLPRGQQQQIFINLGGHKGKGRD